MARGKDWKQAKVSKVEGFKNVNRAQQYTPLPSVEQAYGQGGESFINNIQGTEQQDSTFGFGGPPSPSDRISIIDANDPMEPTSIQSQNATNAYDDVSIVTGGGGSSMQNDITVANVTQTEPANNISFADVQSGAATSGYTQGIPQIESPTRTAEVEYRIPGGDIRTETVPVNPEGYVQGTQNIRPEDAGVYVQTQKQREMGTDAWNALDPTSKANKGEGIAINRGGVDMFFGAKEEKRGAITSAFKEQDFNKMWGNVKHNISSSMGINPKGNTFISTKEGDWDEGGFGVSDQYGNPSSISFGGGYSGKEKHNQHISEIFGFYKEKHKGNKDIITEIEAMQNRYLIGGNKSSNKGGGGATSGLFGFNNKGPQSSDGKNNPLSFYEDLNNKTKNQKFYDM